LIKHHDIKKYGEMEAYEIYGKVPGLGQKRNAG
jgi:hypothetical protein